MSSDTHLEERTDTRSSSASSPSACAEATTSLPAETRTSWAPVPPSATGPAVLPAAPREAGATQETTTDPALDTWICAPTSQERCLATPTRATKQQKHHSSTHITYRRRSTPAKG